MKKLIKKIVIPLTLVFATIITMSCGTKTTNTSRGKVYVYNAGEYIDPTIIEDFQNEYGIEVVYDVFENNEDMYPIVEMGSSQYDCVCPSDYMIQKMLKNDLIQKIDYSKLPNFKNISKKSLNLCKAFDKNNEYTVPYMTGTVGILCNNNLLKKANLPIPTAWADLWNIKYKNELLMQNSVRDAYMIALKKLGKSANTLNKSDYDLATKELKAQKPIVQAYVLDQVRDKMIGGEAMLGIVYSGEIIYILDEANGTYDYTYVVPKEGTNEWIDAWVITKNAKNVENAHLWLDFLCREDIAARNAEYITYDTCNEVAYNSLHEMYDRKDSLIKDYSNNNNEVYNYLGEEIEDYYNNTWKEVKAN